MCLVLLYFVMLCSVDIPGRPVLFLERKQRENRSPGREKVGERLGGAEGRETAVGK